MASIEDFEKLVSIEQGLCTVAIGRGDRAPHVTVVNAGVVSHPVNDGSRVAFVTAGGARKLDLLRRNPELAITIRAGWRWVTVEGTAELVGPDDPHPGVDDDRLRLLLQSIFVAAGGTHEDWDNYDRTMRDERRTAVLVAADHAYSNPS